jgi:hypothetical protein
VPLLQREWHHKEQNQANPAFRLSAQQSYKCFFGYINRTNV